MDARSSAKRLRETIARDRRRIAAGERPLYHVVSVTTPDGMTVDVTIRELPIIHLFVPDQRSVLDGARLLVARTLAVDPERFEIAHDPN